MCRSKYIRFRTCELQMRKGLRSASATLLIMCTLCCATGSAAATFDSAYATLTEHLERLQPQQLVAWGRYVLGFPTQPLRAAAVGVLAPLPLSSTLQLAVLHKLLPILTQGPESSAIQHLVAPLQQLHSKLNVLQVVRLSSSLGPAQVRPGWTPVAVPFLEHPQAHLDQDS